MPIRLRLAMQGVRHDKFFHLVAIDSRKRRDARPLELLGVYRPRTTAAYPDKSVQWAVERIKFWLRKGAQPSSTVVRLLTMGQVIPPDSQWHPTASPGSLPPAGPPVPEKVAATTSSTKKPSPTATSPKPKAAKQSKQTK